MKFGKTDEKATHQNKQSTMKDVWKHIISWGKVLAVLAIVVKGALWLDNRLDSSNDKLDEIQTTVNYNNVELGFQAEAIQGIQDTLDDNEEALKAQGKQIKSLAWGLNNIDQFTPEQFKEVMNEMLKKNSELIRWEVEWPGSLIPPPPSTELTKVE